MELKYRNIILVSLLLLMLGGCKTMQKVKTTDQKLDATLLVEKVKNAQPVFRNIEFKRMNIKVNLNNRNQYSSAATCKIIPDSVIYISVQPFFGIEMFMVRLTPDQIVLVDKTKNIYYQSDYLFFKQQFGVAINYHAIESLLTNKLFVAGTNTQPERGSFETIEKNGNMILAYKNVSLSQHFFLNENFRIRDIAVNSTRGDEQFMTFYSDFSTSGNVLFPSGIRFQFKNKSELFNFDITISRLAVDETINIPLLNLNPYRQGNIMSLLK